MRSLLKRRAALLAAIVSVGDAAGALSTFVQAAHAKSTQRGRGRFGKAVRGVKSLQESRTSTSA